MGYVCKSLADDVNTLFVAEEYELVRVVPDGDYDFVEQFDPTLDRKSVV